MRLAAFFLVLIIALPVLAQSSTPASSDSVLTTDSSFLGSSSADSIQADEATEESIASPTVNPTAQPGEDHAISSTPSPEMMETILPTATPFPTETAVPTLGVTALPTDSEPTSSPTLTAEWTDAQPVEPTLTTIQPTALLFPTVDLSTAIAPTTMPPAVPLTLPALATFDDGASDWLCTPNCSLQPHENGLAWVMTGAGSEMLYWQTPISLRGVSAPVTLNFQSRFFGDGNAIVQASTDGHNWQLVSIVPISENWVSVSADLSRFIGNDIFVGFSWQGTNVATLNQWALDTVLVAEVPPTLLPSGLPSMPTASVLSPTDAGTVPTMVPTFTIQPWITPTVVEPLPSDTPTPRSTDTLQSTATLFPTETAPPDNGISPLPNENEPSSTPSLTEVFVGTQPTNPNGEVTAEPSPTTTSTKSIEVTATEPVSPPSITCELDVDGDGTITESDLSTIGQAVLGADVNETTTIYDLNGNHQVDIGDLQEMASFLFAACPD